MFFFNPIDPIAPESALHFKVVFSVSKNVKSSKELCTVLIPYVVTEESEPEIYTVTLRFVCFPWVSTRFTPGLRL